MNALLEKQVDIFFWPSSRAGVMSAWWGHVPFAHWLVAAAKPATIVELGTHNGASFAAFCEAIHRERIPAKCYAVDTWQGDEHAGSYGEEVHADLSHFIASRYGAFAELLRTTFDKAEPYFESASIDLLHIDGLHTYEAVKHDFENWLPKMSARGIVLFHDTNVRERDFGVWKLWAELRERYDGFEFTHAHGLGVLLVGDHPPAALVALAHAAASDLQIMHVMRERFAQLGRAFVAADTARRYVEHAGNLEKANAHLNFIVNERQESIVELQRSAAKQIQQAEQAQQTQELMQRFSEVSARLVEAEQQGAELAIRLSSTELHANQVKKLQASALEALQNAQRTSHVQEISELRKSYAQELAEREKTTERHRLMIEQLSSRLDAANSLNDELQDRLRSSVTAHDEFVHAVHHSVSWRLTKPVRALKLRSIFGLTARAAPIVSSPVIATPAHTHPFDDVLAETDASFLGTAVADKRADIALVRDSGLFNAGFYSGTPEALRTAQSPIAHYLEFGEAAGIAPSPEFDPAYYLRRNEDLAVLPLGGLLLHYVRCGREEGRIGRSALQQLDFPLGKFDPAKPCMVVAAHEATRTGAAILSWNLAAEFSRTYNVVVLLRRGGPIEDTFISVACAVLVLPGDTGVQPAELEILAERVIETYNPAFVVANSVESRYFVPAFEQLGVPCVALVHEFSSSVRPLGILNEMFEQTSRIVFSAQIVADAAVRDYATLSARAYTVLPQGPCKLPAGTDAPVTDIESDGIPQRLAAMHGDLSSLDPETFVVVGLGTITARKGVEFFIAAADRARRLAPERKIVFAWVGKCYGFDAPYLQALLEQIERADLISTFFFWGELADLDPVYARADVVFLSSRLDPLPNVAIDASLAGVPLVCFDRASGIAEILGALPETTQLVVPYLDAAAAAEVIVAMAQDAALHETLGNAVRRAAVGHFDMVSYAHRIEALALASVVTASEVLADETFLQQSGRFNAELYAGMALNKRSVNAHITHYLRSSSLVAPRGRPRTGLLVRRPLEGFHPLIYAGEAVGYDEARDSDPLVHFLRAGRPAGRWLHSVIRPPSNVPVATTLKVAVHAHFHYVELFPDFARRIRCNLTPADLFLTTTSPEKAAELRRMINAARVPRATVLLVENCGRDIGPMLCSLPSKVFTDYDVVGHFHGKRSPHVEEAIGGAWREFLWQHLMGDAHPMMDAVLQAFALDPTLGLVFAEDPHLNDWDLNRQHADLLAVRMELGPLPAHLDFPQGTMFWARPAALRPVLELGLSPADFPNEPLPIDGTLLHALERILPFAAAKTGYIYATTYVESQRR